MRSHLSVAVKAPMRRYSEKEDITEGFQKTVWSEVHSHTHICQLIEHAPGLDLESFRADAMNALDLPI